MRVISQDNMLDAPFDRVLFKIADKNSNGFHILGEFTTAVPYVFARYKTLEDAKRAMAAMEAAYEKGQRRFVFQKG